MPSRLILFLFISSVFASDHHFDEKNDGSEEHKSGYGYVDQVADFSHDNEWVDSKHKHNSNADLFKNEEHHQNKNKFDNSGSKKHLDEATNKGKDSKSKKYGFYDYHYVEPQYHLEKFFTNEKQAREFDNAKHNHHSARHNENDHSADHANNHNFHTKSSNSNADKIDRSESGNHGHKDFFDEHKNSFDRNSHASKTDSRTQPYHNGKYVPLFAPY